MTAGSRNPVLASDSETERAKAILSPHRIAIPARESGTSGNKTGQSDKKASGLLQCRGPDVIIFPVRTLVFVR